MAKLTNKEITARLKPYTWNLKVNSAFISTHSVSKTDREECKRIIKELLNLTPTGENYVNRDYSASFKR